MIEVSNTLALAIKERLNVKNIDNNKYTKEQLEKITYLKIIKDDINSLNLFPNLTKIDFETFPSITSDDLKTVNDLVPKLKSLKIKEQAALINIDFSMFKNLEELCLIHNENLEIISNLPQLKSFTFYDNKNFKDNKHIVDFIKRSSNCECLLDIIYYVDVIKDYGHKINISNVKWVDSFGLRKYLVHEYTKEELDTLMSYIVYIVSKYIHNTDGDIEKFGILYRWMLNNIDFINEDDPKGDKELFERVNNIYKVFNYGKGGRLSYAKAFQMLLAYAGVKSSVVYSMGALDAIGYYNGKQVYSLLGTSDYALLRVTLEGKYYYTDIAWDSMVSYYKFFDELRLFLVSKEELGIRHKFVGEGNIDKTYSYHGDDSDDLIIYAIERINETDNIFDEVTKFDAKLLGEEINKNYLNSKINSLTNQLKEITTDVIKVKEINDEIKKTRDEIEQVEFRIRDFKDQKEKEQIKYVDYFMNYYLTKDERDLDNNELLEVLNRKVDNYLLSKYVYEILEDLINLRATK